MWIKRVFIIFSTLISFLVIIKMQLLVIYSLIHRGKEVHNEEEKRGNQM